MNKEEFLKLIGDFVAGHLSSDGWKFSCNSMVVEKADNGKTDIKIQFTPVKIEHKIPPPRGY